MSRAQFPLRIQMVKISKSCLTMKSDVSLPCDHALSVLGAIVIKAGQVERNHDDDGEP